MELAEYDFCKYSEKQKQLNQDSILNEWMARFD